jgi:hypothetical protein
MVEHNTVHLTGILVSLGGVGVSAPQRGPRTLVRLPRVSRCSGERAEARGRLKSAPQYKVNSIGAEYTVSELRARMVGPGPLPSGRGSERRGDL